MTISLMPLPYAEDALAPHISAKTLREHHGAHHKGYVDKVNAAVKDGGLAGASLEEIIREALGQGDGKLFNSAAQAWNHGFYWRSLTPRPGLPSPDLARAIDRAFGSFDKLLARLTEEAVNHFGSGWAWLVAEGNTIKVVTTHDAATPLTGSANPLLTIDVWEHAYYLDRQSKRADHVGAVVQSLLDWDFASENHARGAPWTYPE